MVWGCMSWNGIGELTLGSHIEFGEINAQEECANFKNKDVVEMHTPIIYKHHLFYYTLIY